METQCSYAGAARNDNVLAKLSQPLVARTIAWALLAAMIAGCTTTREVVLVPIATEDNRPFPLLPTPRKVIGMMHNFPPQEGEPDHDPGFFVRSPGALARDGAEVVLPKAYDTVSYEAELVLIIGKRARNVKPEDAHEYILGYTCGMDGTPIVTEEDGSRNLARSLAGKSVDGVAPVGPRLARQLNSSGHDIILRVNGEELERSNTLDYVLPPHHVVSQLSQFFTLDPGDMIFMGARRLVSQMAVGDEVEVEISGLGVLQFSVVGEPGSEAAPPVPAEAPPAD